MGKSGKKERRQKGKIPPQKKIPDNKKISSAPVDKRYNITNEFALNALNGYIGKKLQIYTKIYNITHLIVIIEKIYTLS